MTETKNVVGGFTADGFEATRTAFADSLSEVGRGGAAFAAYVDGKKVVDIWGGRAYPGRQWSSDTVSCFYSATKIVPGLVAALLVEKGELLLEEPVAAYWPEFSAGGKQDVTVRQLLAMEAGLPYVPGYENLLHARGGGWGQIDEIERRLAESAPLSPIGVPAYAVLSFGYLVNALVRRVDGRQVREVFTEEFATPLKTDLWLAPPADVVRRAAFIYPFEDLDRSMDLKPGSVLAKAFHEVDGETINPQLGAWGMNPLHLSSGAASGDLVGTAEGMGRLYAMIVGGGELDGLRVLHPETLQIFLQVQSTQTDVLLKTIGVQQPSWMLGGFENLIAAFVAPTGPRSYGKGGAGGQLGWADPDRRLAVGFVRSEMTFGSPLHDRITEALYSSL